MILGDCHASIPNLGLGPFDAVIADIPYSTSSRKHTANHWDTRTPLKKLWECIKISASDNANWLFIASIRLAVDLIASNYKDFKYDLVAERYFSTGFLNSKKQPLRKHDMVLVFARGKAAYNSIMSEGRAYRETSRRPSTNYGSQRGAITVSRGTRYPTSVIKTPFEPERKTGKVRSLHPTQKPVPLIRRLVEAYSNPGHRILDPMSGSGTTAIASLLSGRGVTCIERDKYYFELSVERVKKTIADNSLDVILEVRR